VADSDQISALDGEARRGTARPRRSAPAKPAADAGERSKMSSPDRVVEAIVRGIRAGHYVPGQRLIEADLTRGLSVSRGPVREALKRLAAEGVLTLTRHRGAYVRSLTREEVRDSLVVLEALTGLMARLAARHIGDDRNAELLRTAYKRLLAFRDAGGSAAFLDERRHFYDTLIAIGKNQQLARLMPLMQIHLLRMQFQSYVTPRDRQRQFEEYEAITGAVLAGDARRAERVTRLHIRRTRISLMRLPDDAFQMINI
jgi:DNA-binding GntR family transcriptional regulator